MKIQKINKQGIVTAGFTSVLQHIHQPPNQLYIKGNLPPQRRPTVAIVGSRKPTPYGKEVTERFAYTLAKAGVVVISGLAYGVDAIAHKAALDAGGTTVAVLASGLHTVYPVAHKGLAEDILRQGGALLSEHEAGYEARPYDFLARNRLVSGLADAILVTEATDHSGTASTVAHAIAQNKDVFAVPGPITSLLSAGPNQLLQQGVHVALEARDILEIIAPSYSAQQTSLILTDTPLEALIVELIQKGIQDGDVLCREAHANAGEFLQTLTMMELKGIVKNRGANQWTLAHTLSL